MCQTSTISPPPPAEFLPFRHSCLAIQHALIKKDLLAAQPDLRRSAQPVVRLEQEQMKFESVSG